jgi:hypothetical protein
MEVIMLPLSCLQGNSPNTHRIEVLRFWKVQNISPMAVIDHNKRRLDEQVYSDNITEFVDFVM